MLEEARSGQFCETGFDESVCSALESEMADYLSAVERSREVAAAEKEKIKTLIADISHQTKTPIANLLLYTELLEERELSPENREYLTALGKQAEKLHFLIGALIKMVPAGDRDHHPAPQRAGCEGTAGRGHGRLPGEGREERSEADRLFRPATAWFDRKWTAEAVGNILDNAVKYTSRGGIEVRTRQHELFTAIEVEDTGPGIAEEDIPELFGRVPPGRRNGGTGGRGDRPLSGAGDPGGRGRIYQSVFPERAGIGVFHFSAKSGKGKSFRTVIIVSCAERFWKEYHEIIV